MTGIEEHWEEIARRLMKTMMSPTPRSLARLLRDAVNGSSPYTGESPDLPLSHDKAVEIALRVIEGQVA